MNILGSWTDISYDDSDNSAEDAVVTVKRNHSGEAKIFTYLKAPKVSNSHTRNLRDLRAAAPQVLPAIADMLAAESQLIVLVKPQFEAGKSQARSSDM